MSWNRSICFILFIYSRLLVHLSGMFGIPIWKTEHQIGDLSNLSNDDFAEFLGRGGQQLALAYDECAAGPRPSKRRAIEEGDGGPIPLIVVPESVTRLPPIVSHHVEAGWPRMTVCFDNFTSTWRPGERRAFTYCGVCNRKKRCRKYIFLSDFESPRACAVWLMAWQLGGRDLPEDSSHAREVEPTPIQLQLVDGVLP